MKGVHLRFYTYENRKHHGLLVYERLLECVKQLEIHGGSAFKAIAGFGRHGKLHEQHFFSISVLAVVKLASKYCRSIATATTSTNG